MSALLLRKEFGRDFTEMIANCEFMTFREFVEYACSRKRRSA